MRRVRGQEIAMIFQEPMTSLNPVLKIGLQITEPLTIHLGMDDEGGARPCRRAPHAGRHHRARKAGSTSTRTSCPAACASAS